MVADGYDRISDAYTRDAETTRAGERDAYTRRLFGIVPAGAQVLDLGCGAGVPTTRLLAERYAVTGVDISGEQIRRARENVPKAQFVQSDMTSLCFPPGSFDAVVAFYSIIHVPRDEQPGLFRASHTWVAPGGYFLGALGAHDAAADIEGDWLGAPMYWSSFDASTNRQMVAAAGFSVLSASLETAEEDGHPVTFLWVLARKVLPGSPLPAGAPGGGVQ